MEDERDDEAAEEARDDQDQEEEEDDEGERHIKRKDVRQKRHCLRC